MPAKFTRWDAVALAVAVALAYALLAIPAPAKAATACSGGVCGLPAQAVRHVHHAQPVQLQKQVVAYPNYVYSVGQPLRVQAQAKHDFSHSEEYQEYLQLKAWRDGFAAARSAESRVSAHEHLPSPSDVPDKPTPSEPPTAEEAQQSLIQKTCSKCHTGEEPKGGVWLDGTVNYTDQEKSDLRDRIMFMTYNGRMPPKKPLDDATFAGIVEELYGERDKDEE